MQNKNVDKKVLDLRRYSFNILFETIFNTKKLNEVIEEVFNINVIKDEDKAFINREVNGVIEKIADIDKYINKFSKLKIEKLDKNILIILRIGVYELLYMDKVPVYATINECVNLVKKSKNKYLSGYVNGVLRSIQRLNLKGSFKDTQTKNCYFRGYNSVDSFSFKYKNYDGALKYKKLKMYKAEKYKDIVESSEFKKGGVLIQDASSAYLTDVLSYFITEKMQNNSNESSIRILDTCAAPGGKILGVIDLIHDKYNDFYAEAWDVSKEKIQKIKENIARLKILNLKLKICDASKYYNECEKQYDIVICDVPCSGLGIVDKKPDIKLKFSKEKINNLTKLQKNILYTVSNYVKKDGLISYSTCTTTKEENEEIIKKFISENNKFKILFEKKIMNNDENKCDGFYFCIMKRTNEC